MILADSDRARILHPGSGCSIRFVRLFLARDEGPAQVFRRSFSKIVMYECIKIMLISVCSLGWCSCNQQNILPATPTNIVSDVVISNVPFKLRLVPPSMQPREVLRVLQLDASYIIVETGGHSRAKFYLIRLRENMAIKLIYDESLVPSQLIKTELLGNGWTTVTNSVIKQGQELPIQTRKKA